MYRHMYIHTCKQCYVYMYIYIYIHTHTGHPELQGRRLSRGPHYYDYYYIVAIFYPLSQFCEINISLLSLQKQPNTAPNLFQRGVEYGKHVSLLLLLLLSLLPLLHCDLNRGQPVRPRCLRIMTQGRRVVSPEDRSALAPRLLAWRDS